MNIQKREITTELQESYLDYAMSVIVSRALPDVRDGLKPVQRRILWAMWDSGLTHLAKFRKSANVVGDVLGRYHPHGDISVYDALVRMAQDFSLRYPLIEGQGNFGCFPKDTKVRLTDGREVNFGQLIEEWKQDKKNYTYTVNRLGFISIAEIKNPRLTRTNVKIIKVILDNGIEIRCTPDHRFLLKDGSYKEAKDLMPEDSLMPLYERFSERTDHLNREGYLLIYQPNKDEWVPAHYLADNYNLNYKHYEKSDGRVRHHIDFNKLNNSPDNIKRLRWGEHWRIHYEHASAQHLNAEYREKISAGRESCWSQSENKAKHAALMSLRNKESWKNPAYREKMRRFLSVINKRYIEKHPEKRKEFSERATKTLKRLWQDPVYQTLFRAKIIEGNEEPHRKRCGIGILPKPSLLRSSNFGRVLLAIHPRRKRRGILAKENKNHTANQTGKVKFLKIARAAIEQFSVLSEENYETMRSKIYSYGRAPLWGTGLKKYFENNSILVLQAVNRNHRAIRIEDAGREDVYDLTIDGTNNFALAAGIFVHNSIDGDSAAAYRYTEARLSRISEESLLDIEKETVDWQPNYDATRQEPKVLPAKLPNLLLNGSLGIAVGMTTNIPPHNLKEVAEAILHLTDNPEAGNEELLRFINGPDFPTGGLIFDQKAIAQAYLSGKGPILTRGKADVQERKSRQFSARGGPASGWDIVVTEIPYQVNKAELIKHIAELVQNKKIEGIRDVRDESDREGLRIVIELKNDAAPQKILNRLYQYTDLQKYFHLNMIALVDGLQPRLLTLRDVLAAYIDYRKKVVRRRAEFDLKKAQERAHILAGLAKALGVIDKVIATIKKSKDREDAHKNLVKNFRLSDVQATAILEMKLQTLAALERKKIEDELKEKLALIKELELTLKSPAKILNIIKNEVKELREKYGDERKTQVVATGVGSFNEEDLIPEEEVIITLSASGYIKRLPPASFKSQRRGGKGLIGSEVAEEDFITHFFNARTHDNILFFTDRGRVFQTKAYEIPAASRVSKGRAIHNFLELPADEQVSAVVSYAANAPSTQESKYLIMATKNGLIKKTAIKDFQNIRRSGIIAIALKKGDILKWVRLSSGSDQIILATNQGQSIRFKESQIRAMSRAAAGIRAIRIKKEDEVAGFDIIKPGARDQEPGTRLLVVMANGFAKKTPLKEYKIQNRGGSGIKTAKITAKTGSLVAAQVIADQTEIFALSEKGQIIRTNLESVRQTSRAAQGVKIMNLKQGDKIAGIVVI